MKYLPIFLLLLAFPSVAQTPTLEQRLSDAKLAMDAATCMYTGLLRVQQKILQDDPTVLAFFQQECLKSKGNK